MVRCMHFSILYESMGERSRRVLAPTQRRTWLGVKPALWLWRWLYLQSRHGHPWRPGGQLSVSAAFKGAGAAAADGGTAKRPAGAHGEGGGQPEQEPDRPGSHV